MTKVNAIKTIALFFLNQRHLIIVSCYGSHKSKWMGYVGVGCSLAVSVEIKLYIF